MARSTQQQQMLDTITMLAEQIARTAPECAEPAMKIAELAADLVPEADWATVHDAIEVGTVSSDLSDSDVNLTTDAVMRAVRPAKK